MLKGTVRDDVRYCIFYLGWSWRDSRMRFGLNRNPLPHQRLRNEPSAGLCGLDTGPRQRKGSEAWLPWGRNTGFLFWFRTWVLCMQGLWTTSQEVLRPRNENLAFDFNKTFRVQDNSFPGARTAKQQPTVSPGCVRVDVDRGLHWVTGKGAADVGDTGRKQSTGGRDCTGSVNCRSESRGVNTIPDGDGNLITPSSQTPCGL